MSTRTQAGRANGLDDVAVFFKGGWLGDEISSGLK